MGEEITEELVDERGKLTDYQVAKKLVQLKQSADSRKLEFDLSFKTVRRIMTTKKCYYTGVEFGEGNLQRSVDRVDSTKGYIDGNVVACTIDINSKKANLTSDEIHLLSKKLLAHTKRKK
jgi:hypothetical protein